MYDSLEDLHRALFRRDRESVTLTVADTGVLASSTVKQFAPGIGSRIPESLDVKLVSITDDGADDFWTSLAQYAQDNERLRTIAPIGALLLFSAGLALAPSRLRALFQIALAVAIVGLIVIVAFYLGRATLVGNGNGPTAKDAIRVAYDAFLVDLRNLNVALAIAGSLVAAGVFALIRLRAPERAPVPAPRRTRLPGAIAATAGAAGLLVFAGVSAAGASKDEDPPFEITRCNGSAHLCDRTLDQVAYPSTHNSMGAATEPGWLFASQNDGVQQQLAAGVRGLLIDTHYGVETPRGVHTVLDSGGSDKSREKLAGALGEQGLAVAEQLRRRIGYKGGGEQEVFWCHAFCELGATKGTALLDDVRDFLVSNPYEVLLISIEDGVTPEDTAEIFKRSGLLEYVYRGPLRPMPTLRELIESGERVVVMGEENVGDVPWFHQQFDVVQETPYKFATVAELNAPGNCALGRGDRDNPLFLLNHWVDTSPAPRPENAKQANARPELLGRAQRCGQERNRLANIVAVDLYREGDLFGVVAELNRGGPPAD
jgi:hypothetical protein